MIPHPPKSLNIHCTVFVRLVDIDAPGHIEEFLQAGLIMMMIMMIILQPRLIMMMIVMTILVFFIQKIER